MVIGLFICAVGITMLIRSNLGLSPWEAFHQSLTVHFSFLTMGRASIITGFAVLIVSMILGEMPGIGTIFNIVTVGIYTDIMLENNIIPVADNFFAGLIMICASFFISAYGMYLYIGASLGSGPRDALMIALRKKTPLSVGVVRAIVEISILIVAFILGGFIGIGTVIAAFGLPYAIQIVFSVFSFDVKTVKQDSLIDTVRNISTFFKNRKSGLPQDIEPGTAPENSDSAEQ